MVLRAVITAADAGRRIKHFVRGSMGVSYGQFNSLKVREGLRVNGVAVHANHILAEGEVIEVVIEE